MNNHFDKYKKIKDKLSYKYKGYNLGEIIAFDIIRHIYFEQKKGVEYQPYRKILSKLQESPSISNIQDICEYPGIVFTIPKSQSKRNDYCELIGLTSEKIELSKNFILDIKTETKSTLLSSKVFISFILNFLNNYRKLSYLLSIKEILEFSCRLQFYKNLIDDLEKIDQNKVNTNKYIAFNGALHYENILVKFFQKRGIPTYSLQHAIMDGYFLNKTFPPYDLINVENLQTDYLLCWSQSTIYQIKSSSMTSTTLLLVGNPKYSQWKIDIIKQSFKKCLVFLGGKGGDLMNLEVIDIVKKISLLRNDIEFYFKLHPQNLDDSYYTKMTKEHMIKAVPTNQNLSNLLIEYDFDFTISYNLTTTVYYESLCYGLPCFRYNRDHIFNVYGLDNDHFSTVEELEERILYFQQLDPSILLLQIQEVLKQTVGINIDNYHQHFSEKEQIT